MLADTPLPRGFGAALASVDTFFPRAPEQFVTSPLCLVGYVRWDARSDRVPPLQTIIFSSFTGRTKGCRLYAQNALMSFDRPQLLSFALRTTNPILDE